MLRWLVQGKSDHQRAQELRFPRAGGPGHQQMRSVPDEVEQKRTGGRSTDERRRMVRIGHLPLSGHGVADGQRTRYLRPERRRRRWRTEQGPGFLLVTASGPPVSGFRARQGPCRPFEAVLRHPVRDDLHLLTVEMDDAVVGAQQDAPIAGGDLRGDTGAGTARVREEAEDHDCRRRE